MAAPRLELDYVARPRGRRWIGFVVLAVALAALGALVADYRGQRRELAALQPAGEAIDVAPRPAAGAGQRTEEQARQAAVIVRQLSLPWAGIIEALEKASTGDIALLQLQPDVQQRVLRVTAEARDRAAMLDYLRRLGGTGAFSEVHLVSHKVQADDPSHPVQFVVQALFGTGA
jgi:Tfp pilus assembly protein PilN